MCGSLKHGRGDTSVSRVGDVVPVTNIFTDKTGSVEWSGYAQVERLQFWERGNPARLTIDAESFTEGQHEFRLPSGIMALGLRKIVWVGGKKVGPKHTVKMLTRAAITAFEKSIHSRWPLVLRDNASAYIFSNHDVIKGQQELSNA